MTRRFLVRISKETFCTVAVEADSQDDAIDKVALAGEEEIAKSQGVDEWMETPYEYDVQEIKW